MGDSTRIIICQVLLLITVLATSDQSEEVRKSKNQSVQVENMMFVPDIDKSCIKKIMCENVFNYPEKYIDHMISNLGPMHKVYRHLKKYHPEKRIGLELRGTAYPPCKPAVFYVVPKAARSKKMGWVFIINNSTNPQKVKVEFCRKRGGCSTFTLQNKNKGFCVQNYAKVQMPIIDREGRPSIKAFLMPAGCSCTSTLANAPHLTNKPKE